MNYIKFNPFLPLHEGVAELTDSIFNSRIGDFLGSDFVNGFPKSNVLKNDDEYVIEVAAPGLTKESFSIDIEKEHLVVSVAEEKVEEEEKKYARREFGYKNFKRSFRLPQDLELDKISANYNNGILKIVLPKDKEYHSKSTRVIEVS